MENVINKFKETASREFAGMPDKRRELIAKLNEEGKGSSDYLKDVNSIGDVRKLIKSKKMSNTQIKSKIREFLKNPEELRDFLTKLLDETKKSKKEESKEASATGGGSGVFVGPLTGSKEIITKDVPVVRESEEYCDSCDRVKSKCICDKPKKTETKEATGAAAAGAYSQPAIWAKSMKKKDFAGYRKPMYKGGKFVQVKKKCKKFPYCNQGDIKALKIFENESVQGAIESVSERFGLDKEFISNIVFEQIRKTQQ